MNPQAQEELRILEERLEQSDVPIDIDLKRRVYEILSGIRYCALQGQYKMPGMLVVLGCDGIRDTDYYSVPDDTQNFFIDGNISAEKDPVDIRTKEAMLVLDMIKYYDSAVLINSEGYITDSGVRIEGLNAKRVLREMGIPNDKDLSKRFGFAKGVSNRHMTAICASWELSMYGPVTTYTLSKKTGIIRLYESGNILYSQEPTEPIGLQIPERVIETPGSPTQ